MTLGQCSACEGLPLGVASAAAAAKAHDGPHGLLLRVRDAVLLGSQHHGQGRHVAIGEGHQDLKLQPEMGRGVLEHIL